MRTIILTIGLAVILIAGQANAIVNFNDGGNHIIDYVINDEVFVDYDTPAAGTQINIISGGWLTSGLEAYGISRITINGGNIDRVLMGNDSHLTMYSGITANIGAGLNSKIEIYGGEITKGIDIFDDSSAIINGGTIGGIGAHDSRQVMISGGTFLESIGSTGNGLITLIGNDFQVNGHNVSYGDRASTWATPGIDPYGHPWITGTVTGILESREVINNSFIFYQNGDITFIPEPATLIVLLSGAVLIRNRKRN